MTSTRTLSAKPSVELGDHLVAGFDSTTTALRTVLRQTRPEVWVDLQRSLQINGDWDSGVFNDAGKVVYEPESYLVEVTRVPASCCSGTHPLFGDEGYTLIRFCEKRSLCESCIEGEFCDWGCACLIEGLPRWVPFREASGAILLLDEQYLYSYTSTLYSALLSRQEVLERIQERDSFCDDASDAYASSEQIACAELFLAAHDHRKNAKSRQRSR